MASLHDQLAKAQQLLLAHPGDAEKAFFDIIKDTRDDDETLALKEGALTKLAEFYQKNKASDKVRTLTENILPIINSFSKAKAAKIIKLLLDTMEKVGNLEVQIELSHFLIKWCQQEGRTFLRHRIELRLATLLWKQTSYQQALDLVTRLLKEMKSVDDKHILLELNLLEAKIQHSLENLPKSRAALTVARSCANSIYCAPNIQAELDLMSGILYSEEKDYQTAYSYFFEAFEAFQSYDEKIALQTLKYMILSKIMTNAVDEAFVILNGKSGVKFWGPELEAMKQITKANKKKSLKDFQDALSANQKVLKEDPLIRIHINNLYENLLEQNLAKVIEPYSKVQINHIAKFLNLDPDVVQRKLSEMILDKKIDGTLDQGNGCLIIFDEIKNDKLYHNALEMMTNMDSVLDKLFEKSKKIKT